MASTILSSEAEYHEAWAAVDIQLREEVHLSDTQLGLQPTNPSPIH